MSETCHDNLTHLIYMNTEHTTYCSATPEGFTRSPYNSSWPYYALRELACDRDAPLSCFECMHVWTTGHFFITLGRKWPDDVSPGWFVYA